MANEYATQSELKDYLGIGDTDQDDTLDIILEAASRAVDDYCDRRFYSDGTTSARTYTAEGRFVFVDDISTLTGLAVKTDHGYDGTYEQTWTLDDYSGGYGFRVIPYNAIAQSRPVERLEGITNAWPSDREAIEVTADWGWPSVPPAVKQATLVQAHALWSPIGVLEESGGAPGVASIGLDGSDQVSFESSNVALLGSKELTAQAKALLAAYKRRRLL